MLVLVRLPSPFWIANVNVDIDRSVLGACEGSFRSKYLLCREGEGDDDEGPKEAGVEDDRPPLRRNVGQDIGNVESGFLGGERGSDEDLCEDFGGKGMNGSPPFLSFGRFGLDGASFEHPRGGVVMTGVCDVLKQHGWGRWSRRGVSGGVEKEGHTGCE